MHFICIFCYLFSIRITKYIVGVKDDYKFSEINCIFLSLSVCKLELSNLERSVSVLENIVSRLFQYRNKRRQKPRVNTRLYR